MTTLRRTTLPIKVHISIIKRIIINEYRFIKWKIKVFIYFCKRYPYRKEEPTRTPIIRLEPLFKGYGFRRHNIGKITRILNILKSKPWNKLD